MYPWPIWPAIPELIFKKLYIASLFGLVSQAVRSPQTENILTT